MEFTVQTTIKAKASEIFNSWLNSEGHSKMTGGEAEISNVEGEEFTAWDGYISGKNLSIKSPEYIKQTWRTVEFTDNEEDSILEIFITEKDGESTLKIVHSNLPEHGNQYFKGWDDNYFIPMKSYFE